MPTFNIMSAKGAAIIGSTTCDAGKSSKIQKGRFRPVTQGKEKKKSGFGSRVKLNNC